MGEVYRARDPKLGREVAIKVLPPEVAGDPERLARFEREAKLLASLNHPHIAHAYGFESASLPDGSTAHFLAMELVEGEELSARMKRGAIPIDEALAIARQMAEALEEAHEHGVVHRDLKPANVKLTPDGRVKVLDFGLAKAYAGEAAGEPSADLSQSPTLARTGTRAGVILGTAAYMSPEQARGRPVDKRADIWSFGVVLWEMLSGRGLFHGETMTDVLAAVVRQEIDWSPLPADTPATMQRVLRRCLVRDPRARLRDIGEARLELAQGPAPAATEPAAPAPRRRLPGVAAAAALALLGGVVGWGLRTPPPSKPPPRFASLTLPPGTRLATGGTQPGAPVVSPDGQQVAFVAEEQDGGRHLWVRDLAERESRKLPGTEEASYPFWSGDGQHLGFFAGQKLKRVPARGGSVLTLAEAQSGKGGTWNREGTILFSPAFNSPVYRVSENGGDAKALTAVDVKAGEESHRFPRFLDDGKRFLYLIRGRSDHQNRVVLGSLDGGAAREVVRTPVNAVLASRYLLFLREGTLVAQPFDAERGTLTGVPAPIAEDVVQGLGAARLFADAGASTLVYQSGAGSASVRLAWLDRAGARVAGLGEPRLYLNPSLCAATGKIAVMVTSGRDRDIWVVDGRSGNGERFTFEESSEVFPVFSPDGRSIAFSSNANGPYQILVKEVGGSGASRTVVANENPDLQPLPRGFTPDGRELVYSMGGFASLATTLFSIAVDGQSPPRRLVESSQRYPVARVSPDGRWLLFGTSVVGTAPSLLVTDYPAASRRWQVAFGSSGWWSRDGSELYFIDPERRFSVIGVRAPGGAFEWGPVRQLFRTVGQAEIVGGEGNRFLALESPREQDASSSHLELILHWESLLDGPRR